MKERKGSMTTTVLVRRPVELTETQIELLRFLAGELEAPPLRSRPGTYTVLETHGLIEQGGRHHRYRSTAIGDDVLTQLTGG